MKTCPCCPHLPLVAALVLGFSTGILGARDASPVGVSGGRQENPVVAKKGGFLTRLVEGFTKGGGEVAAEDLRPVSGRSLSVRTELPEMETVVRGGATKKTAVPAKVGAGPTKADLKQLVGGILQRMGPMELERSDEAVLQGSADSLRWLAHPNMAPVVPVAPQPLPFGLSGDKPVPPPVPGPRPEASLLLGKVTEKLERLGGTDAVPAPTLPVSGSEMVLSREEIEARALLAVARRRGESQPALVERLPSETRLSPLGLLAGTEEKAEVAPEESFRQQALRPELRGLMEVNLQPIDPLPPARRLNSGLDRNRPLVLLQPEGLASRP